MIMILGVMIHDAYALPGYLSTALGLRYIKGSLGRVRMPLSGLIVPFTYGLDRYRLSSRTQQSLSGKENACHRQEAARHYLAVYPDKRTQVVTSTTGICGFGPRKREAAERLGSNLRVR
jgi:hypothetical protein